MAQSIVTIHHNLYGTTQSLGNLSGHLLIDRVVFYQQELFVLQYRGVEVADASTAEIVGRRMRDLHVEMNGLTGWVNSGATTRE
mgnify:CR=1 FL=1